MDRFLINVPHESEASACIDVVQIFLETGSHYLTHADWGCKDGVHEAWMIVDAGDRDEATQIVPPPFRSKARVVKLNHFSLEEIEELKRHHQG